LHSPRLYDTCHDGEEIHLSIAMLSNNCVYSANILLIQRLMPRVQYLVQQQSIQIWMKLWPVLSPRVCCWVAWAGRPHLPKAWHLLTQKNSSLHNEPRSSHLLEPLRFLLDYGPYFSLVYMHALAKIQKSLLANRYRNPSLTCLHSRRFWTQPSHEYGLMLIPARLQPLFP
jgi:hypothetical protein